MWGERQPAEKRRGGMISISARFLVAFAFLIGSLCVHAGTGRAQSPAASTNATDASTFTFNNTQTTAFGPAYADIWTQQENFLACKPPVQQSFSYALCFFSGPAVGTPVPANGSASVNPPLPCVLSADGTSADCTCYGINSDQYPPIIPYFVDINAILNLDLYLQTIAVCGHDGENCPPSLVGNTAPVCRAVNANVVIPNADLISVFSSLKNADYSNGSSSNQTSCPAGKYAGCMTAPCYHTGQTDSAGNELVQCTCPVYDGPFELGQAGVPCDANQLTPASNQTGDTYVWSAAHSPVVNHGAIDPPQDGCLPDAPGGAGCPLYSSTTSYPITAGSALCTDVCKAYRTGTRQTAGPLTPAGIQIGYSCDAALCTTVGIGQSTMSPVNPPAKAALLGKACGGLASLTGLQAILALEQADQCSCCASQICGCDTSGTDIAPDTDVQITEVNAVQRQLGITPQCDINGTLCGASSVPALQAAVLPSSGSVQVGSTATAFASIINAGPGTASSCSIVPITDVPASFTYQTTNPATNALTGTANTPIDIPQGASQSFVIAFTPTAAFSPTNVAMAFVCTNAVPAPETVGVNTLNLSASTTPVPNIIALAASGDPGYVDIPGAAGTGDFAVAMVNVGVGATVTIGTNTGSASLPVIPLVCQTDPNSGSCLASPQPSVTTTIAANATPTFGIFVTGSGTVADSPGVNRIFVTATDTSGVLRGETSVAVRTQ
jgi:hypothetical protein